MMTEGIDRTTPQETRDRRHYDEYEGFDPQKVDMVATKFELIMRDDPKEGSKKIAIMFLKKQIQAQRLAKRKALAEKRASIDHQLAFTNEVSGLPNKRGYEEFVEELKIQDLNADITVVFLDMDNLKQINDDSTKGHKWGDEGIYRVGEAIDRAIRRTDFVFNNSGDEFGIILPDTNDEQALAVMDKVSVKMDEVNEERKKDTKYNTDFNFTYGLQQIDKDKPIALSLDEALERADNKMQEKKKERRLMYEK